jgi:hypothetical protein
VLSHCNAEFTILNHHALESQANLPALQPSAVGDIGYDLGHLHGFSLDLFRQRAASFEVKSTGGIIERTAGARDNGKSARQMSRAGDIAHGNQWLNYNCARLNFLRLRDECRDAVTAEVAGLIGE